VNLTATSAGRRLLALATAAALVSISACGSDDDTGTASPETEGTSSAASAEGSTASGPTIAELTDTGSEAEPPKTSPPGAKGKTVWWISCGAIAPDCAVPQESAKEAADKLGITFKSADGNLNQAGGYLTAMRTALAAKPDALILHALDCTSVKSAIEEANKADIPILPVEMPDCDAPPNTGPGVLENDIIYAPTVPDTEAYFRGWGSQAATYLIEKSGGKAKVILNEGTDAVFPLMNEGFVETFKTCTGCEIVDTVTFTAAEQIPNGPWITRFRAALTKNPTADATFIPSDYAMTALGGAKAVQEANAAMLVVGGSGSGPGMDAVRSGLIEANTYAHDPSWMGYAAMDSINRLLQDQPLVAEGVGTRVVTKDKNLPSTPGAPYASPIDWKSIYEKAWAEGTG
jgi:ribose transport system substrate-binding protein